MTTPDQDPVAWRSTPTQPRRRIAVVGSGVAGLTAAHILAPDNHVTLLEADSRLGGHAHTHQVTMPDGQVVPVDSGFIVHNDRTYPTLLRLFDELGVTGQETDMSMSVRSERSGLEYAGALGFSGLLPTIRTALRGRYLLMLGEIVRFHRAARSLLNSPGVDVDLDEFVARERFSDYFRENFLLPLVAAVWSCDADIAAAYPARYLFTFLEHHGMLSVFGSPTWRTVAGGSASYVAKISDRIRDTGGTVLTGSPVSRIVDGVDGVDIDWTAVGSTADPTPERFDAAVIATHPHQALALLGAPTDLQTRVLGAISYSSKPAVLHTDVSLLPRARRAWASWNYQIRNDGSGVAVSYDLTRLMRLDEHHPRMLVTLGRTDVVDPSSVIAEMTYEHPVYTRESVAAQTFLPDINSERVVFAGAYHGWGFHEDGALSGVRAASALGVEWHSGAGHVEAPDPETPDAEAPFSQAPA